MLGTQRLRRDQRQVLSLDWRTRQPMPSVPVAGRTAFVSGKPSWAFRMPDFQSGAKPRVVYDQALQLRLRTYDERAGYFQHVSGQRAVGERCLPALADTGGGAG